MRRLLTFASCLALVGSSLVAITPSPAQMLQAIVGGGPGPVPPATTTWDPGRVGPDVTLSGGDLVASTTTDHITEGAISTTSKSSGKWYAEMTITTVGASNLPGVCVFNNSVDVTNFGGGFAGGDSTGTCYYNNGGVFTNGSSAGCTGGGDTFTTGDVIGVAINFTVSFPDPSVAFYKNGSASSSLCTMPTGPLFLGVSPGEGATVTLNACHSGCATPPAGYSKWDP